MIVSEFENYKKLGKLPYKLPHHCGKDTFVFIFKEQKASNAYYVLGTELDIFLDSQTVPSLNLWGLAGPQ